MRIVVVIIFIAVMSAIKPVVRAVAEMGFIAWLAMIGGILFVAILMENRKRATEGRVPYSWAESHELIMPLIGLGMVLIVSYWLR